MGTQGADLVKNSVMYGNMYYATLDGIPPDCTAQASQSEFLALPPGWRLADWSEGLLDNVILKHVWGATRVVLANGDAYHTSGQPNAGREPTDRRYLELEFAGKVRPVQRAGNCSRVLICTEIHNVLQTDGTRHCVKTLTSLFEDHEFADCEVECDGEVFKCHRAVLAQASPVLRRMLSGEMMEAKTRRVRIEAADAQAVTAFLKFMYTGTLECEIGHTVSLVKLADFYGMDSLVEKSCTAMMSKVDKDNLLPIFRCLQNMRERPHFAPHWNALVGTVRDSEELTLALMTGV